MSRRSIYCFLPPGKTTTGIRPCQTRSRNAQVVSPIYSAASFNGNSRGSGGFEILCAFLTVLFSLFFGIVMRDVFGVCPFCAHVFDRSRAESQLPNLNSPFRPANNRHVITMEPMYFSYYTVPIKQFRIRRDFNRLYLIQKYLHHFSLRHPPVPGGTDASKINPFFLLDASRSDP